MMATEDDRTGGELAELRAELARFVLREAGAAVAVDPDLGLGAALRRVVDEAVRESLEAALRDRRDLDPAVFAERVLRLAEAQARAAAPASPVASRGGTDGAWTQVLDGRRRRPFAVLAASIVLLAAVFAAGWFARGQLAPRPAVAAAPAPAHAGEAEPDAQAATPSGQPAVLSGVELSSRPAAPAPAAASRPRHAAGGRVR